MAKRKALTATQVIDIYKILFVISKQKPKAPFTKANIVESMLPPLSVDISKVTRLVLNRGFAEKFTVEGKKGSFLKITRQGKAFIKAYLLLFGD